jgi:hypothetical protein
LHQAGLFTILKQTRAHLPIHLSAQCAFLRTTGTVSMAWNSFSFSRLSLMYDSSSRLYISLWMFSMAIWKP